MFLNGVEITLLPVTFGSRSLVEVLLAYTYHCRQIVIAVDWSSELRLPRC